MADEKQIARVGDAVRIVRRNAKGDGRQVFYGSVISVAAALAENLGASQEPTVTAAYIDPNGFDTAAAGRADWQKIFTRTTGLRHASHADVQNGATEECYTDILPRDGKDFDLQELNLEDMTKPVIDAPKPGDADYTKPVYKSNGYDVYQDSGESSFRLDYEGQQAKDENGDVGPFDSLAAAKAYIDARPVKVANLAPVIPTTELTQSEAAAKGKSLADAKDAEEKNAKEREQEAAAKEKGTDPGQGDDSAKVDAADPNFVADTRTDSVVTGGDPERAAQAGLDGDEVHE